MAKSGKRQNGKDNASTYRKARVIGPSKAGSSDADSNTEEDTGRLESQDFLAEIKAAKEKAAKQSDACVADFRASTEQDKQELHDLLINKTHSALQQSSQFHAIFMSMLSEGLKDSAEENPKLSWHPLDKAVPPPSYQAAKNLISSSKKLFQTYEKICQENHPHEGPLGVDNEWDEDCWKLNDLFDTQREITKHNVNVLLKGKKAISQEDHYKGDSALESNDLWATFAFEECKGKENTKKEKIEHWAAAVERVENGVRRLVKHLEDEC